MQRKKKKGMGSEDGKKSTYIFVAAALREAAIKTRRGERVKEE